MTYDLSSLFCKHFLVQTFFQISEKCLSNIFPLRETFFGTNIFSLSRRNIYEDISFWPAGPRIPPAVPRLGRPRGGYQVRPGGLDASRPAFLPMLPVPQNPRPKSVQSSSSPGGSPEPFRSLKHAVEVRYRKQKRIR